MTSANPLPSDQPKEVEELLEEAREVSTLQEVTHHDCEVSQIEPGGEESNSDEELDPKEARCDRAIT